MFLNPLTIVAVADKQHLVFRDGKYESTATKWFQQKFSPQPAWTEGHSPEAQASGVKFNVFKMQTPGSQVDINILQHAADYSAVAEKYRYDCMGFALGSWTKPGVGYGVHYASWYDLLNDRQLATKVLHNEPDDMAKSGGRWNEPSDGLNKNIWNREIYADDPPEKIPAAGDILVFWNAGKIAGVPDEQKEWWFLTAYHAMILREVVLDKYKCIDIEKTKVDTKNGPEDIRRNCTLEEVFQAYPQFSPKYSPAGIYRLVSLTFVPRTLC